MCIRDSYSVVAGWTLEYILEAGANEFANKRPDDFILAFEAFSQDPVLSLIHIYSFLCHKLGGPSALYAGGCGYPLPFCG